MASFQQLEASSSFRVAFASLYDLLGDDHVVVASLLYPLVACVLGMVSSLPLQLRLVACVLVVALLPWEELYHQWKMTPIEGVQGDDRVVACALVVASLLYPLVACSLGMVSLPCQVGLVACVLVVPFTLLIYMSNFVSIRYYLSYDL